jgi:hypothetical protein
MELVPPEISASPRDLVQRFNSLAPIPIRETWKNDRHVIDAQTGSLSFVWQDTSLPEIVGTLVILEAAN